MNTMDYPATDAPSSQYSPVAKRSMEWILKLARKLYEKKVKQLRSDWYSDDMPSSQESLLQTAGTPSSLNVFPSWEELQSVLEDLECNKQFMEHELESQYAPMIASLLREIYTEIDPNDISREFVQSVEQSAAFHEMEQKVREEITSYLSSIHPVAESIFPPSASRTTAASNSSDTSLDFESHQPGDQCTTSTNEKGVTVISFDYPEESASAPLSDSDDDDVGKQIPALDGSGSDTIDNEDDNGSQSNRWSIASWTLSNLPKPKQLRKALQILSQPTHKSTAERIAAMEWLRQAMATATPDIVFSEIWPQVLAGVADRATDKLEHQTIAMEAMSTLSIAFQSAPVDVCCTLIDRLVTQAGDHGHYDIPMRLLWQRPEVWEVQRLLKLYTLLIRFQRNLPSRWDDDPSDSVVRQLMPSAMRLLVDGVYQDRTEQGPITPLLLMACTDPEGEWFSRWMLANRKRESLIALIAQSGLHRVVVSTAEHTLTPPWNGRVRGAVDSLLLAISGKLLAYVEGHSLFISKERHAIITALTAAVTNTAVYDPLVYRSAVRALTEIASFSEKSASVLARARGALEALIESIPKHIAVAEHVRVTAAIDIIVAIVTNSPSLVVRLRERLLPYFTEIARLIATVGSSALELLKRLLSPFIVLPAYVQSLRNTGMIQSLSEKIASDENNMEIANWLLLFADSCTGSDVLMEGGCFNQPIVVQSLSERLCAEYQTADTEGKRRIGWLVSHLLVGCQDGLPAILSIVLEEFNELVEMAPEAPEEVCCRVLEMMWICCALPTPTAAVLDRVVLPLIQRYVLTSDEELRQAVGNLDDSRTLGLRLLSVVSSHLSALLIVDRRTNGRLRQTLLTQQRACRITHPPTIAEQMTTQVHVPFIIDSNVLLRNHILVKGGVIGGPSERRVPPSGFDRSTNMFDLDAVTADVVFFDELPIPSQYCTFAESQVSTVSSQLPDPSMPREQLEKWVGETIAQKGMLTTQQAIAVLKRVCITAKKSDVSMSCDIESEIGSVALGIDLALEYAVNLRLVDRCNAEHIRQRMISMVETSAQMTRRFDWLLCTVFIMVQDEDTTWGILRQIERNTEGLLWPATGRDTVAKLLSKMELVLLESDSILRNMFRINGVCPAEFIFSAMANQWFWNWLDFPEIATVTVLAATSGLEAIVNYVAGKLRLWICPDSERGILEQLLG